MADLVWYASYGSNLLRKRFLCYIRGGTPNGAAKKYHGCSNQGEPVDDKSVIIPHELYFSKKSSIWENSGVAFIKSRKDENVRTLGRMYLITSEQFMEIVHQENGLGPNDNKINIDFQETITKGESIIPANWYSRIMYLDSEDEWPIFTFTANWSDEDIELYPPGEKYLRTIIKGIKETYDLPNDEIFEYIRNLNGVKKLIEETRISKIIMNV